MENPTCMLDECGDKIEDEETFVDVGGGVVHHGEAQSDAGGGKFHPECAKAYIDKNYSE